MEQIGMGPVALDTAVFIYFIEEHPRYLPAVAPVFEAIAGGTLQAITSALTLLEVLVIPLRSGDLALAERYERILSHSRGLCVVEIDRPLLRAAAHLRARTGIRTPDSLQLAAALGARCTTLVTNDRKLPAFPNLRVLQLGDFAVADVG